MADSRYCINNQPTAGGFLKLEGDPGPWIEANSASCLLVRMLLLYLGYHDKIGDSIKELKELTELKIYYGGILCAPNAITTLLKLKGLRFYDCGLEELPRNFCQLVSLTCLSLEICDNITKLPANLGQLKSLANLYLNQCNNLTALPANLGQLKSLKDLHLSECKNLTELPETLGHLESLFYLTLHECDNIKSLPDSMKNLCNLRTLNIVNCKSITKLPIDFNVSQVNIDGNNSIKFLPKGFTCQHLELYNSANVLENTTELVSIQRLTIWEEPNSDCCPTLNLKFKPSTLSIKAKGCSSISKVLASSDGLSGLMVLDIKDSIIKWLPWSIKKLRKLRTLILPRQFRLESLPYHLNDSVFISVHYEHVRKTWKELKTELKPWFSLVSGEVMAMEEAQNPYDAKSPNSLARIRFLEFNLFDYSHLYFDDSGCNDLLPETSTRRYLYHTKLSNLGTSLNKLSNLETSLDKLSNLETLDIDLCSQNLPTGMNLPASLKRLTLRNAIVMSFPASMEKLTNLKALDLIQCDLEDWNPIGNLYHTKLKLSYCSSFTSLLLPAYLCHLELLGSNLNECSIKECLKHLVYLETLSVTCDKIEYFPSITGLSNLQELRLKDCFKLKNLPPNLDDMVKLCILDISGTIIKYLPHSILNLHNLQQLILPKWFTPNSLFMSFFEVSAIDDTPEAYYQMMDKDYPIATNGSYDIVRVVEAGFQGSELQVNAEQGPPHDGNSNHAQRDISRVGEASSEELEMELVVEQGLVHGRNNHHPLKNRQNLNSQNDIASVGEAGFEERDTEVIAEQEFAHGRNNHHPSENMAHPSEMEFITEQDIAHTANNHQASENGQDKNPQSDSKRKTLRKDISKEMIESCWAKSMTAEEAALELDVSKSTLKRRLKELGLAWPRFDVKKRKHHIEQPSGNASDHNLVNNQLGMPNHESCNYDAVNISMHNPTTTGMVIDSLTETQRHMDGHQHAQQHLGSANAMQHNGTSSTFDVKAAYKDDIVRFGFCLTCSIDKLYEEVGKMLKLDVASFKIKYQDEENDWILMSCISNVEHALTLSKLSGSNVVRLLVVDKT